jgi:hypothetical protein
MTALMYEVLFQLSCFVAVEKSQKQLEPSSFLGVKIVAAEVRRL